MTIIGVPKEIKEEEYRVAMTPAGALELTRRGHKVLIERNAGLGSGFIDEEYLKHGAEIVNSPEEVFERADIIVKVKEPLEKEWKLIRAEQTVFTYLHLAADKKLTEALARSGATCIAYETVQRDDGSLPLLAPMSEIAGRMAPIVGARFLAKYEGGKGVLMTGSSGIIPAKAVVLGGGFVGANAALVASGLNARVTVLEINIDRIRKLNEIMPKNVNVAYSNEYNIRKELKGADLIIGAVLIPGRAAPKLLKRDMLREVEPGSVLVDVAIDQGGCTETSRPTGHRNPVYTEEGVVHYCVTNMPGAYPRTSTIALTNSTLNYVLALAELGWKEASRKDKAMKEGLNIIDGKIVNRAVAESHGMEYHEVKL
jgi:alanine dehydrogenase